MTQVSTAAMQTARENGQDVNVLKNGGALERVILQQLAVMSQQLEIFYYGLLEQGVYIPETRSCFLSTAHGEAEIERVYEAVREVTRGMREAGFFQTGAAVTGEVRPSRETGRELPLTESQKDLWLSGRIFEDGDAAYNLAAGEVSLLGPEERSQALAAANGPAAGWPDLSVPELITERAQASPDSVAIVEGATHLTYGEFERRSSRLAGYLREKGVCQADLVGVCLERGIRALEAIFAVWKSGAAYVPMEPDHPPLRLQWIMEDAEPALVLSETGLRERLPYPNAVWLDEVEAELAGHEGERPAAPGDAAYVIYTSGSTGRPKGVRISHRALTNYVQWAKQEYASDLGQAAFAWHTSFAFDLTVTSLYTPLASGGTVVVYPGRSADALEAIVAEGIVEVLKLTPSHLAILLEGDLRGGRLRRLVVGGEALETGLARRVWERLGGRVEIINEYGPTEATVGCMIHRFDPGQDRRTQVPIGRPAANTRIYVLDEELRLAPEHVPGEIYIGGAGLADGYWKQERLTRERFVEDPFGAGGRLYKTGDRARRLPQGIVEYLGRNDGQVKIRGHRIELGEIRAALNRHPQVRDSAVAVKKDRQGAAVLVAYYVARQPIETGALRESMRESLPAEMMPGLFVHLSRLPLTLHGKVDYGALPGVDAARERNRRAYEAPRTQAERRLAEIWAEVLGAPEVGVEENFFELGGDSVLAARVHAALQTQVSKNVSLLALFQYPTVRSLAEHLSQDVVADDQAGPDSRRDAIRAGRRRLRRALAFSADRPHESQS